MLKDFLLRNNYALIILLVMFIISNYINSPLLVLLGCLILFFTHKSLITVKGRVDKDLALLIFVFLSYTVTALINNNATFAMCILRSVPSIFLFILGYNLTKKNMDNNYWYFILLITALLTGVVNIYYGLNDTIQHGFIVPERMFGAETDDFELATSLIASQLIPTIACLGLFFDNPCCIDNKHFRWFGITLAILGELCAIHYISRAGILIMGISILLGLIYRSKFNFRTIVFIIITIAAYLFFLETDAYAAFELKNEVGGDLATGNGRDERMLYWLNRIIDAPMGIYNWKNHYSLYPWAHNFWIDFTKDAGWIPGLVLVLFSLRNLYYVTRIAFKYKINKSVSQLVLLLGIAYFLTLFTEPTMHGAPLLMFSYFMFCGIVKSIYKNGRWQSVTTK